MSRRHYRSWGRYPEVEQRALAYHWRSDGLPQDLLAEGETLLPVGNRRSYGDVCLNGGGAVLDCTGISRFISFDADSGVLVCEAGVLLSDILQLVVPQGWFLSVTPGTRFVTVGGAIANDVHGKNHHRNGTFGCHVRRFELLRSDGSRRVCSLQENPDWFAATIGGLGLTGVITWAELQLRRVANGAIDQEVTRFGNLEEFLALSEESDASHEYTVAWVDCLARGKELGRGIFTRGNHTPDTDAELPAASRRSITFPVDPPFALINHLSVRLFNTFYYYLHPARQVRSRVSYQPFFYPLDAVLEWNRLYGRPGFMQYQCVVPVDDGGAAIGTMLETIAQSGAGSFLVVLKMFGKARSPGLLSFPRPGATLALDFPNHGEVTMKLLERLDAVTREAGGLVYPAKDARMSAAAFQAFYPDWEQLEALRDPLLCSGFWRRVTGVQA